MLVELFHQQFPALLPLFAGMENNLMVHSLATGNSRGRAWTDDPDRPQVALVWDMLDWAFLAGPPTAEVAGEVSELLAKEILPDLQKIGVDGVAIFPNPDSWTNQLTSAFPKNWSWTWKEEAYFQLEGAPPKADEILPDGFSLQRINGGLLARGELANLDQLLGWILSFWRDQESFLNTGFGFAALTDKAIASWCLTVFAALERVEIGLATAPEFRERGLGTAVASACVDYALSEQREPLWHCWADNAPSLAIAQKIGYRQAGTQRALFLKTPAAENG